MGNGEYAPTAQVLPFAAAAPNNWATFPAFGGFTTFQRVPSQCSVTGKNWTLEVCMYPTAVRFAAERDAMPRRIVALPAIGLATRVHFAPSQCSIKAWPFWPRLFSFAYPTAHTLLAAKAVIPYSALN